MFINNFLELSIFVQILEDIKKASKLALTSV